MTKTTPQWELDVTEALEAAEQVKSWSKYDRGLSEWHVTILLIGSMFLGVVIAMVWVTPTILEACK